VLYPLSYEGSMEKFNEVLRPARYGSSIIVRHIRLND